MYKIGDVVRFAQSKYSGTLHEKWQGKFIGIDTHGWVALETIVADNVYSVGRILRFPDGWYKTECELIPVKPTLSGIAAMYKQVWDDRLKDLDNYDLGANPYTKVGNVLKPKEHNCECGAYKTGYTKVGRSHSIWCPMYKE